MFDIATLPSNNDHGNDFVSNRVSDIKLFYAFTHEI